MTQKDKESLKWLLVEAKAIVDTDSPNPYAGIFLNNLCDVIEEFVDKQIAWNEYGCEIHTGWVEERDGHGFVSVPANMFADGEEVTVIINRKN